MYILLPFRYITRKEGNSGGIIFRYGFFFSYISKDLYLSLYLVVAGILEKATTRRARVGNRKRKPSESCEI